MVLLIKTALPTFCPKAAKLVNFGKESIPRKSLTPQNWINKLAKLGRDLSGIKSVMEGLLSKFKKVKFGSLLNFVKALLSSLPELKFKLVTFVKPFKSGMELVVKLLPEILRLVKLGIFATKE
ncbi:hypothetical protein AF960_03102 [Listeria monocytogenes]|nr:hypothetical protein AF960_03102 [Listeria monocytogenes]